MHRRVGRRGRGGGGIHRCGSLRADDCGLIDRRRAVFSGVQLGRSTVKRATAPTQETYKGRYTHLKNVYAPPKVSGVGKKEFFRRVAVSRHSTSVPQTNDRIGVTASRHALSARPTPLSARPPPVSARRTPLC